MLAKSDEPDILWEKATTFDIGRGREYLALTAIVLKATLPARPILLMRMGFCCWWDGSFARQFLLRVPSGPILFLPTVLTL